MIDLTPVILGSNFECIGNERLLVAAQVTAKEGTIDSMSEMTVFTPDYSHKTDEEEKNKILKFDDVGTHAHFYEGQNWYYASKERFKFFTVPNPSNPGGNGLKISLNKIDYVTMISIGQLSSCSAAVLCKNSYLYIIHAGATGNSIRKETNTKIINLDLFNTLRKLNNKITYYTKEMTTSELVNLLSKKGYRGVVFAKSESRKTKRGKICSVEYSYGNEVEVVAACNGKDIAVLGHNKARNKNFQIRVLNIRSEE